MMFKRFMSTSGNLNPFRCGLPRFENHLELEERSESFYVVEVNASLAHPVKGAASSAPLHARPSAWESISVKASGSWDDVLSVLGLRRPRGIRTFVKDELTLLLRKAAELEAASRARKECVFLLNHLGTPVGDRFHRSRSEVMSSTFALISTFRAIVRCSSREWCYLSGDGSFETNRSRSSPRQPARMSSSTMFHTRPSRSIFACAARKMVFHQGRSSMVISDPGE